MNKFYQTIEERTYPSKLIKFKHSFNKARETIMPQQSPRNIFVTVKNGKLLLFKPLKKIQNKENKTIYYSYLLNKINCKFSLHNGELFGKIDSSGNSSEKWIKFNDVRSYHRAINLYKKNNTPIHQKDFEVTIDIQATEESQTKIPKNNADE